MDYNKIYREVSWSHSVKKHNNRKSAILRSMLIFWVSRCHMLTNLSSYRTNQGEIRCDHLNLKDLAVQNCDALLALLALDLNSPGVTVDFRFLELNFYVLLRNRKVCVTWLNMVTFVPHFMFDEHWLKKCAYQLGVITSCTVYWQKQKLDVFFFFLNKKKNQISPTETKIF